jgi:hypothetical protein
MSFGAEPKKLLFCTKATAEKSIRNIPAITISARISVKITGYFPPLFSQDDHAIS